MMGLSISEFSTYRWSLEKEIEEYSRRGIQSIGLWRSKLSDLDIEYATDLLYLNDLKVSSLSWAGGFTGACGMSHEEAIEDGLSAIRTAARIGAECLILHPGNRHGHTRNHSRRLFATAIERMLPMARDFGVVLAMETVSRQEAFDWTVFDTVQESIQFANEFLPQELAMVLDLFHVGDNVQVFQQLPSLTSRLALVQLSDRKMQSEVAQRCSIGTGDLNLQMWFNELQRFGYRNPYEVEVFGPMVGEPRYRRLLDDSLAGFEKMKARQIASTKSITS